MRRAAVMICALFLAVPLLAQGPSPRARATRTFMRVDAAESAVRQAAEQLVAEKKIFDRDVEVLEHLRSADRALVDPMQPTNAVQKAFEEVTKARAIEESVPPPDFVVLQGIIRALRSFEDARRSPLSADFGHLRAVLQEHALGPASRAAIRNALRLEEETLAWLKVQQMIADHLRLVSQIAGDSLRASQQ